MAQSEPCSPPRGTHLDAFFLGKDSHGNWVAQDLQHKRCGLFVSEAAALRFARSESANHSPEIIRVMDPLEFKLDG